jgi:hypothetical protein
LEAVFCPVLLNFKEIISKLDCDRVTAYRDLISAFEWHTTETTIVNRNMTDTINHDRQENNATGSARCCRFERNYFELSSYSLHRCISFEELVVTIQVNLSLTLCAQRLYSVVLSKVLVRSSQY